MTYKTDQYHNPEVMHVGIEPEKSMTERSVQLETKSISNVKGQDILRHCAETQQSAMPMTSPRHSRNLERPSELAASLPQLRYH
jgi:hypothetical protein